jgi:hypothetical protein
MNAQYMKEQKIAIKILLKYNKVIGDLERKVQIYFNVITIFQIVKEIS